MNEVTERAVRRTIESMHENLSEPLTIDDLARTAMFSKFHFTRVFQQVTGVSPGRFLSAVRLHEAKNLLVDTSLSVIDVSSQVGYTSVGTFSTRFKNSVGVSPSGYRRCGGRMAGVQVYGTHRRPDSPSTIRGRISAPAGHTGAVFVGLFPERICQGVPVRGTVLQDGPGRFALHDVPPGNWYVIAQSTMATPTPAVPVRATIGEAQRMRQTPVQRRVAAAQPRRTGHWYSHARTGAVQRFHERPRYQPVGYGQRETHRRIHHHHHCGKQLAVACNGPLSVRPSTDVCDLELPLHPIRLTDPPTLLSLLDMAMPLLPPEQNDGEAQAG